MVITLSLKLSQMTKMLFITLIGCKNCIMMNARVKNVNEIQIEICKLYMKISFPRLFTLVMKMSTNID